MWEFGYIGLALFGAVFVGLGIVFLRSFASAPDDGGRALAVGGLCALATTALLMVLSAKLSATNYTVLFWTLIGFGLAAERLRNNRARTA